MTRTNSLIVVNSKFEISFAIDMGESDDGKHKREARQPADAHDKQRNAGHAQLQLRLHPDPQLNKQRVLRRTVVVQQPWMETGGVRPMEAT